MNPLVVSLILPLVGVGLIALLADGSRTAARWIALAASLAALYWVGKCVLTPTLPEFDAPWFSGAGVDVRFSLGLDGLSLWMFGLSALLSVTAVLVSWEAILERGPLFYSMLLVLETGMLGVFAARDLLLFYVFFEFTLIPLFFLIGIWGSEQRRYAAVKFFLFTLAGSVLTFLGMLAIVLLHARNHPGTPLTFHIPTLAAGSAAVPLSPTEQFWIFVALFAGFAVKVPLFPLHTWLPLAHVQAPTAGSVLLAGVLLKIGTYGFLRFSLPMLPDAAVACMPWVLWLSTAGILYGALTALAQSDVKRLIAYSSVSHLGYCMLGLFAFNRLGMQGGVLQMINHGLSTGGLFAVFGMIYERYHTREIRDLGGLARRLPRLSLAMLLFTFSSIGLPGMNGFAGEFLILLGMFQRATVDAPLALRCQWIGISTAAVFGVVLGAWYMLWLIQRVFFGPLREPAAAEHDHGATSHGTAHHDDAPPRDLNAREFWALAPLVVLVFWIGLTPQTFLAPMQADVNRVTATVERAMSRRMPSSVVAATSPADEHATAVHPSIMKGDSARVR